AARQPRHLHGWQDRGRGADRQGDQGRGAAEVAGRRAQAGHRRPVTPARRRPTMAEEILTQASALQGIAYQGNEFASLLNKEFKPKSDDAKSAVEQAVLTLAQQALAQTSLISSDVIMSIEAMIAELD